MCGISGYLDLKKTIDCNELRRMNDVIKHRGPDDEGYVLFDCRNNEESMRDSESVFKLFRGNDTIKSLCSLPIINEAEQSSWYLGFGHRRLSIIDLTDAGHQPMSSFDGKIWITFNGEIYNYLELRQELSELGFSFKTQTDTEVIIAAYMAWGERCVNHFNGMWGFVIYDMTEVRTHRLFCSRDRLGAKPFYYYLDKKNGLFVFGSEIKQLCQNRHIPRTLNRKHLATVLILTLQDYDEETLIESIHTLSGGHNMMLELDMIGKSISSIRKYQYWDLDYRVEKKCNNDWYDYLHDGIRLRLRSDAPIGIMISGGIDSTFLAHEISFRIKDAQIDVKNINGYTSCYKNDVYDDETYYSHQVIEACGLKENLIYPDRFDMTKVYEDKVWHCEDYFPFGTLGAYMTLEQVSKSGVKVILNGQGGDESMFGYERYYAFYLKDLIKKNLIKGVKTIPSIVRNSRLTLDEILKYIVYFNNPKIRYYYNTNRASDFLKNELMRKCLYEDVKDILYAKDLDELVYKELRRTQLTHILRADDRNYMAFSMESRVPFIDYRYLEAAIGLDPHEKIKNGFTKYPLRQKMQGDIPDAVVWRKNKNGWSSPADRWVERFDEEWIHNMFENPRTSELFNVDNIKKKYRTSPTSKEVMGFVFTETFIRLFKVDVV